MEWGVSDGCPVVATELGQSNSDVFIRAGNQTGNLYDEHDWIAEYDAQENHQKSGDVPKWRSGVQDFVSSLEKHFKKMDNADTELEWSDESIRHTFWESTAEQQFQQQLIYTKYLTRSNLCTDEISSPKGWKSLLDFTCPSSFVMIRGLPRWSCVK